MKIFHIFNINKKKKLFRDYFINLIYKIQLIKVYKYCEIIMNIYCDPYLIGIYCVMS